MIHGGLTARYRCQSYYCSDGQVRSSLGTKLNRIRSGIPWGTYLATSLCNLDPRARHRTFCSSTPPTGISLRRDCFHRLSRLSSTSSGLCDIEVGSETGITMSEKQNLDFLASVTFPEKNGGSNLPRCRTSIKDSIYAM